MRQSYDLSTCGWTLSGWHPQHWRGTVSVESGMRLAPAVAAIPARVPGSVQQALLEAGILPNWNVELHSRDYEWVENRHWVYETTLPAEIKPGMGQVVLVCEGLDYQGVVLVNGREVGSFCGTHVPHTFDLTPLLGEGPHRLAIVFTDNPHYLGQIGYTSQMREWKSRFYYGWDWVPRLVQMGIWDGIRVEVREGDALLGLRAVTEYDRERGQGSVTVVGTALVAQAKQVEVAVIGAGGEIGRQAFPAAPELTLELGELAAAAWHPNGNGEQPLYTLRVRMLDEAGNVLDEEQRQVGFRQVEWQPCAGAPADALPWVCVVNGIPTFLQGANWVPPRTNFADVTQEQVRQRLESYRELGCNLLRVWGGSTLERESFYRTCDELGIMVWQELPLSSSGLDNWPPEDEESIRGMEEIAASHIARRQHHPSLLMWCGGNELLGGVEGSKVGMDRPLDTSHPMLAAQARVAARLDPGRRFLPCSPFGPRTWITPGSYGQGLHHDVHGPWNHAGPLESWYEFWDKDDALFHSEIGMPGAESAELIRKYGGRYALPGERGNPWWTHTGGWWIQWDDYLAGGGDPADLEGYVHWSQERQAQALGYAARACKRRFPACGGFVIWMGHDCYPCPVNTAVIDFAGELKPAALALAAVFREK